MDWPINGFLAMIPYWPKACFKRRATAVPNYKMELEAATAGWWHGRTLKRQI